MKNFKVEYITQWSFITYILFGLLCGWTNDLGEEMIPDIVQKMVGWILTIAFFGSIAFFIILLFMGREFGPKK